MIFCRLNSEGVLWMKPLRIFLRSLWVCLHRKYFFSTHYSERPEPQGESLKSYVTSVCDDQIPPHQSIANIGSWHSIECVRNVRSSAVFLSQILRLKSKFLQALRWRLMTHWLAPLKQGGEIELGLFGGWGGGGPQWTFNVITGAPWYHCSGYSAFVSHW